MNCTSRCRCAGLLVAVALLAGCTSPVEVRHNTYPIDWPALAAPATGCPDLGGRYRNADSASGRVLLARWVLPDTRTPLEVIRVVELEGPRDRVLTLRLYEAGETALVERGRRQWKEGEDYACDNGWLVLSNTKVIPLGLVVANTAGRFTRAQDGSLVVERREEGGGVILVVPAYLSVRDWFRFERADPPLAGAAAR
jgi:hypothetical protein